ncbi:MAG: hypothetical protein ACFFD8_06405 [Candidatus Thorarchaeota archaeon]
MRWFKRPKKEEKTPPAEQTTDEEASQQTHTQPKSEEFLSQRDLLIDLSDPVSAFIQRMESFLNDPEISEKTMALKDTWLQIIVGGEQILLSKRGVQPLMLSKERSIQSDVFIRMSSEAAGEVAMAETLSEFKKCYKQMVTRKGEASYISIKFHTPLEELRAKGYFSVELLRILIDA